MAARGVHPYQTEFYCNRSDNLDAVTSAQQVICEILRNKKEKAYFILRDMSSIYL
jgi:hypothetical protein